jgi:hypothetical protein
MANQFSSGKRAIAECDVCGFRFKLTELKKLVVKNKVTEIKACSACWVPDQPQLQLGLYPVNDPQALREPRPDLSYYEVGANGGGGSRVIQWGWNPVGGARADGAGLTPNSLAPVVEVGTVTVDIVDYVIYDITTELSEIMLTEAGDVLTTEGIN